MAWCERRYFEWSKHCEWGFWNAASEMPPPRIIWAIYPLRLSALARSPRVISARRPACHAWYGILQNAASCASRAGAKTQNWNNNTEEFREEICPFHSGNVSHRKEKCVKSSCKGRASSRRPGPDEICEFSPGAKKVLMLTGEAELIFTDKILVCGCENVAGGKFRQKW